MSLLDKIKKNSTIKDSAILSKSKFFTEKDMIPTSIPMVNVALSGKLEGGLTPGLTMWAGPSKHFKTAFSLLMAKSYMDKYDEAVLIFYDSEFGTPQSYFDTFGIDTERVLHTPLTDIEQLKFDIMKQLEGIERNDRVMIIIDSIGNLASKKEIDDALEGKSVADMSRAKQVKSLFRMVTPHLNLKDIPMVVVNHTYMEILNKHFFPSNHLEYQHHTSESFLYLLLIEHNKKLQQIKQTRYLHCEDYEDLLLYQSSDDVCDVLQPILLLPCQLLATTKIA